MTKLAIVGSHQMSLRQAKEARELINTILDRHDPQLVVSGGADGVDKIAADCARRRGVKVDEKLPDALNWHAYRRRNVEIAEACDVLVRIGVPNSVTSGSTWTLFHARKLGRPTEHHMLHTAAPGDPRLPKGEIPNE